MNDIQQQIDEANAKLRELRAARRKQRADARRAANAAALGMSTEQYSSYSRQYLWQLKKIHEGKCSQCGTPSPGRKRCDDCSRASKRQVLPDVWTTIAWHDRTVADIAKSLNVTEMTVYRHRNRLLNKSGVRNAI